MPARKVFEFCGVLAVFIIFQHQTMQRRLRFSCQESCFPLSQLAFVGKIAARNVFPTSGHTKNLMAMSLALDFKFLLHCKTVQMLISADPSKTVSGKT